MVAALAVVVRNGDDLAERLPLLRRMIIRRCSEGLSAQAAGYPRACTGVCVRVCVRVRVRACARVCMYVRARVYIHTHAHTRTHTRTHTHTYCYPYPQPVPAPRTTRLTSSQAAALCTH
jgi:hypothetical protein